MLLQSNHLFFLLLYIGSLLLTTNTAASSKSGGKEKDDYQDIKKKDVRDYTDADLERLYDQWEEDEEPLEEDELPEYKRPRPNIDLSKLDPNNPEMLLRESKKGQTLMMFVTINGNPTEKETEKISGLWQSALHNAHHDVQRYVVGSDRFMFVLKDGSKAWDVKDYLIEQKRCGEVTIEGKSYTGKHTYQPQKEEL